MMALKHQESYYQSSFFKWRQRIGFGISDFGCCLAYLLTNTYLLFYYTNCAGIPAGAAGIMFTATKCVDAVTDYLVGRWTDRTDTKMGRYRPWMLAGTPVLAIGMVLLFSVPVAWSTTAKLVWAYVTYIIFSFGYTLVNIPMIPIVNTLSPDPVERTKIVTTKQILAALGSLTSSVFVLPLVRFFSGNENATGSDLAYGYRMTNVVLGIVVVIVLVACVLNVEEIVPPTTASKDEEKNSNMFRDLIDSFKNKYYAMLLTDSFFYFLGYLAMVAAIQYYFTYVIGNTDAMSLALTLMTAVPIPVMLFASWLVTKGVGKGRLIVIGSIIDLAALIMMLFTTSATITVFLVGLWAVGMSFRNCLMFAAFPDVYDATEYDTGRSLAGTQTAVMCFGSKVASALASASVSAFLVWANYDGELLDNLLAAGSTIQSIATNYPTVVFAIKMGFIGISIVTTIITILSMLKYDLDSKMPTISAELNRRRGQNG